MSKQDIEKRLGFAAQGVKAEMAAIDAGMMDGSGNKVVIRMADGSRATAQYNRGTGKWSLEGHADIPAFAKVRDLVAHLNKQGMSRPGVKAKMGKDLRALNSHLSDLLRQRDMLVADDRRAGGKDMKVANHLNRIRQEIDVVLREIAKVEKSTSARPGVKTSFSNGATTNAFLSKIDAATRNKILTSIAKHYGISASQAMAEVTDADAESLLDYMTEPERSATSVLLKRHGFSRAGAKAAMAKPLRKAEPYEALYYKWFNGIQVSIMDMTKIKNDINAIIASGANPDVEMPKLVKKYGSSGFSRLGAKAKMGRPKTVTVITMMSGTGGSGGLFKVVGYDENGREFEYGMFAMRSMAEQKAKDVARWTDSKYISSRPSTKAKMGSSQVNDSATTADLIREAQRLRDVIKTSNREFDKTHLRQIKQELDRRGVLMPYGASEVLASRPGAKAKA